MANISASDVKKLREMTGAGMMDCKKALGEADGDFEKAAEIIRKKGIAVASKRADREATEGAVLARVTGDGTRGAIVVLNSETDFVAKNEGFVELASSILDLALEKNPANLEELKGLEMNGTSVSDVILQQVGIIGEKIDISYYGKLEASMVVAYIHPGNKLATLVGLNKKAGIQVGRDVAMQVAAMNPVSVDKDDIPQEVIDKEIEIGKEQARQEGKPEELLERIAMGKLNKFYKESTLLNQDFTKDNKKTVKQYLQEFDKELTVTGFLRYGLGN
ncbi:MAG: elongation factor Ts [Marinilabiliales bacterium]|nr:MAG: elongation factor Ts [Marinilabiliales bacterium]